MQSTVNNNLVATVWQLITRTMPPHRSRASLTISTPAHVTYAFSAHTTVDSGVSWTGVLEPMGWPGAQLAAALAVA